MESITYKSERINYRNGLLKCKFIFTILIIFLICGCATTTDWDKLNSQSLDQHGVVVAESAIFHHGASRPSSISAALRNMNKRNKSKLFNLENGIQVAIVEPGRYRLNLTRLDMYPGWIMMHKKSQEFDVDAGEIVYLGRVVTHVFHPGAKEMLTDPHLWGSALTSSVTGVIGYAGKMQIGIQDNSSEMKKVMMKRLGTNPEETNFRVNLIEQFTDKSPFG